MNLVTIIDYWLPNRINGGAGMIPAPPYFVIEQRFKPACFALISPVMLKHVNFPLSYFHIIGDQEDIYDAMT
ncbi:hypothetical protein [Paenibacillus sp. Soil522]|uniref:hypothetical protein n=1 Tax=Paenibacillus sp. Soil522 TaxID=1736388 RepID=UPI00138ED8C1|nr:hypothetical protein [Paenibacillus sp. Soil522]